MTVRARTACLAGVCVAALVALLAPAAQGLDVRLVNRSDQPAGDVYVMLHGGSSSDGKLSDDVPRRLSAIDGRRFQVSSLTGGRIFFSYDHPVTAAEPPESKTRYDKVELSLPGVANLTAVDFFGIPFRLEALNPSGGSLGRLSFDAPTKTIRDALLEIKGARRALVKTRYGGFARILSPQLSRTSYPSFAPQIAAMTGRRVTLHGAFYGTPYQEFAYSGRFADDGSIALHGTITAPNGGSPSPPARIAVAGSSLPAAIYTVDGPYTVAGQPAHAGDNDVYSAIYRDLVSGFAWGYMGGRYGNDSANWLGKPPFEAARRSPSPYATFNEYAAAIYRYSDAYGFSFSDTGPKPVQLPLDEAATLRVTILR